MFEGALLAEHPRSTSTEPWMNVRSLVTGGRLIGSSTEDADHLHKRAVDQVGGALVFRYPRK